MKQLEPQDIPGFKWVLSRIESGEAVTVYLRLGNPGSDQTRLYHGGQRRPEAECCHVGTYAKRKQRIKFDLFQFIEDIRAAHEELEAQNATLGMGR